VTKVFKGAVTVGQQFRFAQGGGSDCIWEWDEERVGNEYLLYLGEPSVGHPSFGANDERAAYGPMYYVSVCGRSTALKGAADDLSFLNRLNVVGGKTRLSGLFKAWYDDEIPKANIAIRIIGTRKTYLAKTDAHGFYEIYGLPAGKYVVRPAVPFGWKYEDYMINQSPSVVRDLVTNRVQYVDRTGIPVNISPGRHASLDIWLTRDTLITGTVIGLDGKPVKDIGVKAVSTELKDGDFRGHDDYTDENGRFAIDQMEPGDYRLVVERLNEVVKDSSTDHAFFPSTVDFKRARIIHVPHGGHITGLTIRVPKSIQTVTLLGQLFYSDGRGVPGGTVRFVPENGERPIVKETDANGKFKFVVRYGSGGNIFGELPASPGQFEDCPEIDELLSGKSGVVKLRSEEFWADATKNLFTISIKYRFPFCVERKTK
jgi:hypothetical protein